MELHGGRAGSSFFTSRSVKAVRIITEGRSGRSKGFGFVEMESSDGGQSAIDTLNGKDFGGRELRVDTATERS